MLDPVPWLVGGGAVHSPEVTRTLAYVATGGAAGVVQVGDLTPSATPVPSGSVRVSSGAFVIPNTYASQQSQSYIGRNVGDTDIAIAASGGAARSDMLVVRIDDPQYGGTTPVDPASGPYVRFAVISNVGPTATAIPAGTTYPAIPIARIDLPASTATVASGMVTSLRKVANPRRKTVMLNATSAGAPAVGAVNALTSAAFAQWPAAATWQVEVPAWATYAQVRGDVNSFVNKVGATTGEVRNNLFGVGGSASSFDENYGSGNPSRNTIAFANRFAVPANVRGTTQTLSFQGKRSQAAGYIDADAYTTSLALIEFVEEA